MCAYIFPICCVCRSQVSFSLPRRILIILRCVRLQSHRGDASAGLFTSSTVGALQQLKLWLTRTSFLYVLMMMPACRTFCCRIVDRPLPLQVCEAEMRRAQDFAQMTITSAGPLPAAAPSNPGLAAPKRTRSATAKAAAAAAAAGGRQKRPRAYDASPREMAAAATLLYQQNLTVETGACSGGSSSSSSSGGGCYPRVDAFCPSYDGDAGVGGGGSGSGVRSGPMNEEGCGGGPALGGGRPLAFPAPQVHKVCAWVQLQRFPTHGLHVRLAGWIWSGCGSLHTQHLMFLTRGSPGYNLRVNLHARSLCYSYLHLQQHTVHHVSACKYFVQYVLDVLFFSPAGWTLNGLLPLCGVFVLWPCQVVYGVRETLRKVFSGNVTSVWIVPVMHLLPDCDIPVDLYISSSLFCRPLGVGDWFVFRNTKTPLFRRTPRVRPRSRSRRKFGRSQGFLDGLRMPVPWTSPTLAWTS